LLQAGGTVKAVVLAAGKGTRMRGLCDERPKPLMPLANRPALVLTIERLRDAGVDDVLVVVGHGMQQVKGLLGKGEWLGVNVAYAVQEKVNGTGAATLLAEDFVGGEPFVLTFGDVLAQAENYSRAVSLFREGADAVVSTFDTGRRVKIGALFARGGRLVRIVERPAADEASTLVNAGLFVFPPKIFETTRGLPPAPSGEHELTAGIQGLVDAGLVVRAMPVTGYWSNLTDPDALLATNANVQKELAEAGAALVDESAEVAADAQIDAFAAIGPDARVGRAEVGSNVSIGAGSRIDDGCALKSCIVLEGARIGAGAVVENAVVDSGACVPPGAVLQSPCGSAAIIWKTMYPAQ